MRRGTVRSADGIDQPDVVALLSVPSVAEASAPSAAVSADSTGTAVVEDPAGIGAGRGGGCPRRNDHRRTDHHDAGPGGPADSAHGIGSGGAAAARGPSPEVLMERHGTVGFLIRNPEPRNFLDVINPFARMISDPGS